MGVVRPFVAFAFVASAFVASAFVAFVVASSDAEPSAASVLVAFVAFVAFVAASFAAAWQDLRLVVAHRLAQG